MDNELFDLCKEVYERTFWNVGIDKDIDTVWCHGEITRLPIEIDTSDFHQHVPLYTSDYLLEKLPAVRLETWNSKHAVAKWFADGVPEKVRRKLVEEADTPLKALLKLVIALDDAKEL